MKKYKIDNYIVTANSLHDAVSIVRQIKDAYGNGIILEKHETYKGPNGQFTVVKVRRDNGRIQYVVTSDKRDIDAGDKMPSGTIENDLASAIKTAKEYANARKRNSDDFDKDYARESQAVEKDVEKTGDSIETGHEDERQTEMAIRFAVKEGKNQHGYYEYQGNADVAQVRRVLKRLGYHDEGYNKNPAGMMNRLTFYFADSVKDGKYVSELKPGDVITKKDGSKWDVVLVRNTPFGIQVRMNSKTSPVKTEEITYRPTDMLVYDSVKDSVTVRDIIQSLVTEETSAISSYNVALETLKDHIPAEAYEAIKAIRDDEQRHVENLYAVLNGNVTPKNLEN